VHEIGATDGFVTGLYSSVQVDAMLKLFKI